MTIRSRIEFESRFWNVMILRILFKIEKYFTSALNSTQKQHRLSIVHALARCSNTAKREEK